jgi:Rad3-related DNA helicase
MNYNHLKSNFVKFRDHDFRPYQEDVIEFIEQSDKPISVIQAPTGFGKSLANVCAGSLFPSFTYLVSSKQLQNQLYDDFPELEVMKGRNNYPCLNIPGNTADECVHGTGNNKCYYKKNGCPYEVQKQKVLNSPYRLLNYHYFMTEANYIGKFSDPTVPFIICDEGDMLEGLLASFISLYIPGSVIQRLGIPPPPYKTTQSEYAIDGWRDWASEVEAEVKNELSNVEHNLEISTPDDPDFAKLKKAQRRLSGVKKQTEIFINNVDKTWIFEEREPLRIYGGASTYIFKPTWVSQELSEEYFFKHGERFALTSATFPPHTVLGKLLGRPPGDFDYYTAPSSFPVKNRKVYLSTVSGNLTAKTWDDEVDKIVDKVGELVCDHVNEKGIIHAVSYKLANYIIDTLGSIDRFITHNSKNREEILDVFKNSSDNLVLVSPSIERGVDLPDDDCRFVIWAKAPFLSLGDKLTKSRVYSGSIGNLWYRSLCAQTIVQGCGRGVRHKYDSCTTYILDKQIKKLILGKGSLFPKYFKEAVEL